MGDPHQQYVRPGQRRPRHAVIYYWGVAVLFVGLVSAALIFVFAADDGESDLAGEITSGRMYEHNVELMGGKLAVYTDQFNQWFAGLWHGRPLAYTIAVLAIAIALVCFWLARLMSVPLPREPDEQREN